MINFFFYWRDDLWSRPKIQLWIEFRLHRDCFSYSISFWDPNNLIWSFVSNLFSYWGYELWRSQIKLLIELRLHRDWFINLFRFQKPKNFSKALVDNLFSYCRYKFGAPSLVSWSFFLSYCLITGFWPGNQYGLWGCVWLQWILRVVISNQNFRDGWWSRWLFLFMADFDSLNWINCVKVRRGKVKIGIFSSCRA